MTALSWVALAYLMVGLGLAAVVYHALNGGFDDYLDETPCEDCGAAHRLSDEERKAAHEFDKLNLIRETDRGRFVVAVLTAVACLMVALAWPAVIVGLAWPRARGRKQ